MRPLLALALASLTLGATAARAGLQPPAGGEFQLFVENDMLARTDHYYTNGIKFGVGAPFDLLQHPAADMLRQLAPQTKERTHVGLFLGQNLYTPKSIKVAAPQPNDRPWAAWLYIGGVAQRAKDGRLDTVEIDLGMVGPAAQGEAVQKNWHRLIDSPQPMGWSNQLPNEPAFVVSYLQKRRYGNNNAEIIPHGGITLGTVTTLARIGGLVRAGRNMSGFGPDTIEPGGAMLHGTRASEGEARHGSEWYVFAGVDQRLVAQNIFLDGTVFRASPSVERRPHVWDLSVGFSFRYEGLRFSWTRIRRSEDFYTPAGGGGRQTFDSLNLGIEFR